MTHALEFEWVKFGDFKSFIGQHKVSLKLTPGLYFFTGKNIAEPQLGANGCGKSTVFDAVFWCFWGKTVKDSRPANAVVPWDDAKASPAAMVYFRRNGEPNTIIRTRKPNRLIHRTQPVDTGTEYAASGDKEITQDDVPGILGMNEETFRRTILIGQFGTMFLDLKPEAQSAMFTEALELDRWLKASKLAGIKQTEKETGLAAATGDLATLTGRLEELRSQRATAKEQAAEWDVGHVERVDGQKVAVNAYKVALVELDAQPQGKPLAAAKLRTDRDALKVLATRAGASVKAADTSAARLRGAISGIQGAQKAASDKLSQLEAGAKDKLCPSCGQTVTGKHLAKEIDACKLVIAQLQKQHQEESETLSEGEASTRKLEKLKTLADKNVEDLGEKIAETEKAYYEWKGQRDTAETKWNTAKTILVKLKDEENPHTDTVARLLERINDVKAKQANATTQLQEAEKAAGQYKFWTGAFKEIRLSLIDEVLVELEIASAAHAERLGLVGWEIKFHTERETKSGDTSYGFNILLFPPGRKEAVRWESYSGGEDRRWQLAVTFGLSEVLLARAGLTSSLEVLDEPAQHMSAEGVEALLESLSDRARELKKTIYYIDHVSLDRGWFDGVFTVVHDKKGSRVTK